MNACRGMTMSSMSYGLLPSLVHLPFTSFLTSLCPMIKKTKQNKTNKTSSSSSLLISNIAGENKPHMANKQKKSIETFVSSHHICMNPRSTCMHTITERRGEGEDVLY